MNPYVIVSLKNLRMGHANYYMLIDNAHTFLPGHSLVHLLTPKCLFHLRQDVCPNFKCFDVDFGWIEGYYLPQIHKLRLVCSISDRDSNGIF